MSLNIYQQNIIDHYNNPRNFDKKIDYTYKYHLANTSCGDEITFYLKVEEDIVKDISFDGRGCSISIASASMLSEEFLGKETAYLQNFSEEKLMKLLGITLTPARMKCALLPLEASKCSLKA